MPANAKIRGKNIHPVHKMQYQNVKMNLSEHKTDRSGHKKDLSYRQVLVLESDFGGVPGGARTHDLRNHNPTF